MGKITEARALYTKLAKHGIKTIDSYHLDTLRDIDEMLRGFGYHWYSDDSRKIEDIPLSRDWDTSYVVQCQLFEQVIGGKIFILGDTSCDTLHSMRNLLRCHRRQRSWQANSIMLEIVNDTLYHPVVPDFEVERLAAEYLRSVEAEERIKCCNYEEFVDVARIMLAKIV